MRQTKEVEQESKSSSVAQRTPKGANPSTRSKDHPLGRIQRTHGNQAAQRLVKERIQPKLELGTPNDRYEREADRVAKQVMRMSEPVSSDGDSGRSRSNPAPAQGTTDRQPMAVARTSPGRVQRMCSRCERRASRGKSLNCPECEEELRRKESSDTGQLPTVDDETARKIGSHRGRGDPLSHSTREFFEPRFGYDLGGISVHTGSRATELNRSLDARAFTVGRDIFFRDGAYQPGSVAGRQLLAHELTHVVQADGRQHGQVRRQEADPHPQQPDPQPQGAEQGAQAEEDPVRAEWEAHPDIHGSFRNGLQDYRALRPRYRARGIQNPAQYLDDNIVWVRFFERGTYVHRDLRQPLANAEAALQANPPNLNTFWGWVPRLTAEGRLSNHALGRAIDINRSTNPHIRNPHDIRVIEAVTGVDLGQQQDAQTMRAASQQFQNRFGDGWVQQKQNELDALNNFMGPPTQAQFRERQRLEQVLDSVRRRRDSLDEYAQEGFLTLDQPLIDAFTDAGFEWGGEWINEKDFMHFEIDM